MLPTLVMAPTWGQHIPDGRLLIIAIAALAVCLLYLGAAAWRHRRNLASVPVRIHVAGTRGKSTTTRMIAAGLRAGGRRVLAKTTGSAPRLILPDGNEQAWPRRGPANVREQMRLFAKARKLGVDTVVVECMAVRPELVWASEVLLVRATTAVITNARADHYEEVGETAGAAAEALRCAVPKDGKLIVSSEAATPEILADKRRDQVTVVETSGLAPQAANKALALAVCAAHGVAAETAGPAADAITPDPGAFFARELAIAGKPVRFLNAFACNDVASLAQVWGSQDDGKSPVVLFNARADRPLRTRHFFDFLAAQTPTPVLFLIGDPLAKRLARRAGLSATPLRARTPGDALNELAASAAPGGAIWGIGNYQGFGARLIAELKGPSLAC